MENFLHFSASTNVKDLFGKGLVTDQIAAVFELIKNSYDADATEVHIIFGSLNTPNSTLTIKDNGIGMSLDDIQKNWMVIGTDSKKNTFYSPLFKRPLNGDKGIGRFSVDRLGSKLCMHTKKIDSSEEITAYFNWSDFEGEAQTIEAIDIPYELTNNTKTKSSGVTLEISELRDTWDTAKIKSLIRNLRQFKSPISFEDNFKIYVTAKEYGYNKYEIKVESLENVSSLWVEAEIKENDLDKINIKVNRDGLIFEETHKNPFSFGSIKAQVFFFNHGDKIRFNNRYSLRVKEYGNIRLFRDDFRIYPYGEENNDWLRIDQRQAQGFSRFFGTRDLIGYVQTSKTKNKNLIPLTNRQGLIENDYYNQLKTFVVEECIKTLEKFYFSKFKKNTNETILKSKERINVTIKSLDNIVENLKKENPAIANQIQEYNKVIKIEQKNQMNYLNEQQELVKVYSRIAQKETTLQKIMHQSMINIKNARTAIENLEFRRDNLSEFEKKQFEAVYNFIDNAINLLVRTRNDVVMVREKKLINISESVKRFLNNEKEVFSKNNIDILTKIEDNVYYKIDERDLSAILNNLTSNSQKSLNKVSDREKQLTVELYKTNKYIIIKVSDNGIGINEFDREKIFDPFHSTTGSFGLGLTIIDDTVKEYGGALELLTQNDPGACFIVKLRC